ncbi:MAG: ATP-binding cassette domain-containing protein [Candidatus Colwellbacteria bacterium]|nr:ATP-binding cassette domain-containing protein [Candidatus Colwellbacteria bacterium]
MINFQNVSKRYNGYQALIDVNFKIIPQEFVSIVGRSGAGKSTVVKLLIAEDRPTSGRVTFGRYDVSKLKYRDLPELRRHIGTVFQDFRLLHSKNVYENVAFALEVAGRPEKDIDDLVKSVLDLVDLGSKGKNFVHELSGGEKQRVAIARAMVNRPDVIIADEPTGNLDPFNTLAIINLLTKINELGTTVILATHNKDIVNQLGRRVILLENGRLMRDEEKGKYSLS